MKLDLSAIESAVRLPPGAEDISRERLLRSVRRDVRRLIKRRMEGLVLYQELPACRAFHESNHKWRVLDGSNRAGKTLGAAAEAVRSWLGADPYKKYIPKNGKGLVIGLDGDHIAQMWNKCANEGAFKIIPDEHTGLYRAVRASAVDHTVLDPYDDAHREKWRDSPPLIPPRMIQGNIAWDDKAKGIPRLVKFVNGWQVLFRSSEGKSPQGEHYNMGWIDEQISNEQFYLELVRGLVSLGESHAQRPKGFWSATPQTSNMQLYELRERADTGTGDVAAFQLLIEDNPYIPPEEKLEFYNSLSDDERKVRFHGIYAVVLRRIYDRYDANGMHGVEPFEIPDDWARYVVLDPGKRHCGTLFIAVDPEERHMWVYDGFDHQQGDADSWAAEVAERQGPSRFEAMVIDQQMGRQHPPGAGLNVAEQYMAALKRAGCTPRMPGDLAGFVPGTNDVDAREKTLLGMMTPRSFGPFTGEPILKVFRGVLPQLDKQIKRAQIDPKTGKRQKLPEDLLVCLEYISAYNPTYAPPERRDVGNEYAIWKAFQRKRGRQSSSSPVSIGAGIEIG